MVHEDRFPSPESRRRRRGAFRPKYLRFRSLYRLLFDRPVHSVIYVHGRAFTRAAFITPPGAATFEIFVNFRGVVVVVRRRPTYFTSIFLRNVRFTGLVAGIDEYDRTKKSWSFVYLREYCSPLPRTRGHTPCTANRLTIRRFARSVRVFG